MSVQALAWAKRQKAGSASAKLVLMILADYADEHGRCWPARSTIAEEAELTIRSVSDQLKALEAAGLIERDTRTRDDGSQTSSTIQIRLDREPVKQSAGEGVQEIHPPVQTLHPPVQEVPGGVNQLPTGGEPRSPREPPEELLELEATLPVASAPPDAPGPARSKGDPWRSDGEFEALWQAATPEMRRRAKSKAKAWPEWLKAKRVDPPAQILLGLAGYLERDPDVKRTGGPGLHIWLKDRTWQAWTGCGTAESPPSWTADQWAAAIDIWRQEGRWGDSLGPRPGEPGCRAPAHLLPETRIRHEAA